MKQFSHTRDDNYFASRRTRKKFWFAINLVWVIIILFGAPVYWSSLASKLQQSAESHADRYADSVHVHLQRFEVIPRVLAELPYVQQSLFPGKDKVLDQLNEKLFDLNKELGTDVIYIINRKGETLASSNYQSEDSFVGQNYGFRPYFKDAIEKQQGRYHALGSRSGKLGYYYSAPIYRWDIIVGVVVAKINLDFAQQLLEQDQRQWIVTDQNHVAFLSSEEDWLYKTLQPMTVEVRTNILESRQYGDQQLEAINKSLNISDPSKQQADSSSDEGNSKICLRHTGKSNQSCTSYLYGSAMLPEEQWVIYSLYSPREVVIGTLFAVFLVSISYWLIALTYAYLSNQYYQRRYLALVNDQLEDRLNYLTQDLRKTNSELRDSVTHYREAKEELERTQDELIQAEKLAVLGEVAVGLNHELNQPLLAIKAYSENAKEFLVRENVEAAKDNLGEINQVTETMAMIISKFRVFSRKSTSATAVDVGSAIDGALVIFMPRARSQKIQVLQNYPDSTKAQVYCDQTQLQQVILNLLANAAQAIENQKEQVIEIKVESDTETVRIKISDNGPGMEEAKRNQLFTPFFTTKPQGLGLGLSLSKRIIEAFDGSITFRKSSFGGTEFEIALPNHSDSSN